MDQIPDSISQQALQDAMIGSRFPLIADLPVVRFGDSDTGTGTGDLYFLVTALIDRAENGPNPLQAITMICGMLKGLIEREAAVTTDGGFVEFAMHHLPASDPATAAAMRRGIEEHLQRQHRKMQGALDALAEHQQGLLQAAVASAIQNAPSPAAKRDELRTSASIASDALINSLGITREQMERFKAAAEPQ